MTQMKREREREWKEICCFYLSFALSLFFLCATLVLVSSSSSSLIWILLGHINIFSKYILLIMKRNFVVFFLFFFFLKLYYLQYEKILANTTLTLTQTPLCFYPSPLRAAPIRSRINIYWLRFVSGFWFFKIFDLLEFHPFHNLDV